MQTRYDYLTIGHISRDVVASDLAPSGYAVGGTVAFSAETAHALNCRTAVLTSTAADFDYQAAIPHATVVAVESAETTSFSNIYTDKGRIQLVHSVAAAITATDVPAAWRDTPIVHLGPITDRVDPQLVNAFPHSMIGITPQGWMRKWEGGKVSPIPLQHRQILLPRADAVVIGEEDLSDPAELVLLRANTKLLVMTRSASGCVVFSGENQYDIPAPAVEEVNATGAGDIFATAFFVSLWHSRQTILESAEFANKIAAASVTQIDLAAKVAIANKMMAELNE